MLRFVHDTRPCVAAAAIGCQAGQPAGIVLQTSTAACCAEWGLGAVVPQQQAWPELQHLHGPRG